MKLEALFQNPTALPTAPKVVDELISSFDKASVSTEDIAKKLSADPVLSAKLLRLANSAYYHVSRSIGTVEDAVLMLGFVTVRTLVISSGLVSGFKTVPGLDLRQFWRYSLRTAVGAKFIAKACKQNTDLAFTIGMMHAIGQLLVDHAPGFDNLDAHGAIKRVQREAGVCCEEMTVDMGTLRFGDMEIPLGERPVKVPESMAFDDMSQERAEELFKGVTDWIAANIWPDMPAHAVEEMALMIEGER